MLSKGRRNCGQTRIELPEETYLLLGIAIGVGGCCNLQYGHAVGNESEVDMQQAIQTLAKQACAHQEHNCHRELNDDHVGPERRQKTPEVPREPSERPARRSASERRKAGSREKIIPAATATRTVKASTRAFRLI